MYMISILFLYRAFSIETLTVIYLPLKISYDLIPLLTEKFQVLIIYFINLSIIGLNLTSYYNIYSSLKSLSNKNNDNLKTLKLFNNFIRIIFLISIFTL